MKDKFIEKWQTVREIILDMGNDHIRGIEEEFNNYDISRRRYTYEFYYRGKRDGQ